MINLASFYLAQSETSTATWAVLMVVVSALIACVLAFYRMMNNKIANAENEAKSSESKLDDARHSEIKTMVASVDRGVHEISSDMKKIEGRVSKLEIGHSLLNERMGKVQSGGGQ